MERSSISSKIWLINLRWIAVVAQVITIFLAYWLLEGELPLAPLLIVVLAVAISNFLFWVSKKNPNEKDLGLIIVFDVIALTLLLYFSGGAANPFGFFYVLHVALAAILLGARWTWVIASMSVALYGLLFVFYYEIPALSEGHHAHHPSSHNHGKSSSSGMAASSFSLHLQGMWLAFALVASTLAFFFTKFIRLMEEQSRELRRLQDQSARMQRISSVTALAATAAHELNSPLCTIKIASTEMVRHLEGGYSFERLREDASLINQEVEKCSSVLEALRCKSGAFEGEVLVEVSFSELVNDLSSRLEPSEIECLEIAPEAHGVKLVLPRRAFTEVLLGIVRNALESGPLNGTAEKKVKLTASRNSTFQQIMVEDNGRGISPDILSRLGEPFLTSKRSETTSHGGLGLGIFLAKSLVEQSLKGTIEFKSEQGKGTLVLIEIPVLKI